MIVFRLILKVFNDEMYIGYVWLRVGYWSRVYQGKKSSGCIKGCEYLG
jgi:hypothetical protein